MHMVLNVNKQHHIRMTLCCQELRSHGVIKHLDSMCICSGSTINSYAAGISCEQHHRGVVYFLGTRHGWSQKMFAFIESATSAGVEKQDIWCENRFYRGLIDPIHKSTNAPVPYRTMLHSEQKCAHFCSEWSIVGYGTGSGIFLNCSHRWRKASGKAFWSTMVQIMAWGPVRSQVFT